VIGSRDPEKAQMAVAKMKNVAVGQLDLASPDSIDRFANEFLNSNRALDLLINNAGIMATPLMRDDRGYEMQFATNHLGHFQLTARLLEALKRSGNARVVALSSYGHSFGAVDFSDPDFNQRPYDKWVAYGQSKSANSLFAVDGVYCEDCDIAAMVPADGQLHSGVQPWAVDKTAAEALWTLSGKLTSFSRR
jgi:NAD(P)-dependent dehydrogenase (short-subunit alcohol dehydrogenase family)